MADRQDERLTLPCTLDDVRVHWGVKRSTFYRWLSEIRDEHPGVQFYGKRGRHTRVP